MKILSYIKLDGRIFDGIRYPIHKGVANKKMTAPLYYDIRWRIFHPVRNGIGLIKNRGGVIITKVNTE